jgi:hypothetical protein
MFRLETERLFLRHFHILDDEPMYRVFGDAEVMRFGDGVQTHEWVRNWIRTCLEQYYANWGFGPYAVVEQRERVVVGYCGLFYFPDVDGQPEIEIGYRLVRSSWGKGYATMIRLVLHLSCVIALLLLSFTSCSGQSVSRCQPERDLPKNPKPGVVGLNLSRDWKTLVTAGADGKIRIWNVATGQVERTLSGHTNSLYKADFSPNEKLLASSSRDRTARIWDFATGRELHKLTGFRCSVKSVAFSPNGKTLAVVGNDGMLKLWMSKQGKN